MERHRISGIPVVEADGRLAGILTHRDVRFAENPGQPVAELMTRDTTVSAGVGQDEARCLLHQRRIEKAVVDDDGCCVGLITVKDIEKAVLYPGATKDGSGRLRVAAATTVGDKGFERTEALIDAEVDLIDSTPPTATTARSPARSSRSSSARTAVQVIAGNVATAEATRALIGAGRTGSRSASAPDRSAPPASSPASACCRPRVLGGGDRRRARRDPVTTALTR